MITLTNDNSDNLEQFSGEVQLGRTKIRLNIN